jgi:hypothetical protein
MVSDSPDHRPHTPACCPSEAEGAAELESAALSQRTNTRSAAVLLLGMGSDSAGRARHFRWQAKAQAARTTRLGATSPLPRMESSSRDVERLASVARRMHKRLAGRNAERVVAAWHGKRKRRRRRLGTRCSRWRSSWSMLGAISSLRVRASRWALNPHAVAGSSSTRRTGPWFSLRSFSTPHFLSSQPWAGKLATPCTYSCLERRPACCSHCESIRACSSLRRATRAGLCGVERRRLPRWRRAVRTRRILALVCRVIPSPSPSRRRRSRRGVEVLRAPLGRSRTGRRREA